MRIYACWCEQDQSLDLAKHLYLPVAGTHASFPLACHFTGFTLCWAGGVLLPGQMEAVLVEPNTERSAIHAGLVQVTSMGRQALTLPKSLTFLSCCRLESGACFTLFSDIQKTHRQTHPPYLKIKEANSYICEHSGFCSKAALVHMHM